MTSWWEVYSVQGMGQRMRIAAHGKLKLPHEASTTCATHAEIGARMGDDAIVHVRAEAGLFRVRWCVGGTYLAKIGNTSRRSFSMMSSYRRHKVHGLLFASLVKKALSSPVVHRARVGQRRCRAPRSKEH